MCDSGPDRDSKPTHQLTPTAHTTFLRRYLSPLQCKNAGSGPQVGRPKKLTGALASGGYELMMLDGGEGAEAWRGATPGGGGGLVGLGEGGGAEVMLPGPGEYEADCLAQRWASDGRQAEKGW